MGFQKHSNRTRFAPLVLLIALFAVCATLTAVAYSEGATKAPQRTCFAKASWDAPQGLRPCVRILHVGEDGSFEFGVYDANGTERYTGGVGALDR